MSLTTSTVWALLSQVNWAIRKKLADLKEAVSFLP
jgi:hypothetical protein